MGNLDCNKMSRCRERPTRRAIPKVTGYGLMGEDERSLCCRIAEKVHFGGTFMRNLSVLILLGALSIASCVAASLKSAPETCRSLALRKRQAEQQKAMKKYAKAQRKAQRKMLKTERKIQSFRSGDTDLLHFLTPAVLQN